MNVRKSLGNRIRGWLPKEPILPSHATLSQTRQSNARPIFLNLTVGFLILVGLFCCFFLLSNSWIKFLLIGLSLVTGVMWAVSHGRLRKALKFTLIIMMIVSISFTAVEGYLFLNVGYPATYTPTQPKVLSLQTMLNASLEQVIQGIEGSQTFSLLKLEYGDNIAFESMQLQPVGPHGYGYIRVDFASIDSHAYFHFFSSDGHQFILQPSTYSGQLMSQIYPSNETPQESLGRIDTLGLNWFYNQALEIAQNRTTSLPTIDTLHISLTYGQATIAYSGITVELIGYHETTLLNGGVNGDGVLIGDFQPNGALIYMSNPAQK